MANRLKYSLINPLLGESLIVKINITRSPIEVLYEL